MVIEEELLAEGLEKKSDAENGVRRIAGMDDVEAPPDQDFPCQYKLPEQG